MQGVCICALMHVDVPACVSKWVIVCVCTHVYMYMDTVCARCLEMSVCMFGGDGYARVMRIL